MSLRGPVNKPYDEALRAEFDGTDGTDGTGWTEGLDGHQKCPLNIFILCLYIDKVYTYL